MQRSTREKSDRQSPPIADDLPIFAQQSQEDGRNTRWAVGLAVILHLLFFAFKLPEIVAAEPEPQRPEIFVVTPTRFKPPPPEPEEVLPEPLRQRRPIPDPTPDDPEPIRPVAEIRTETAISDPGMLVAVPEPPPPPADPRELLRVGGDVTHPVRIYSPPPVYTEIARRARIEGVVVLEATIDERGLVRNVEIVTGLPLGLDQASTEAVARWRFEPATLHEEPVAVLYNLTIRFRLQ